MRMLITSLMLVAIFIVSYLIWGDYFESWLAGDDAVEQLRSYGPWAWLIAIGLIMTDVALPIPATAIFATLGIIYGPVLGGLIASAGAIAAGTVAYLLCRALGKRAALRLLGEEGFRKGHDFFNRAGGWAIVLSRWMIILPEMISCLAGLTRMKPRAYFTALVCGVLPMAFTYAYIGHAGADRPVLAICLSAAVPVLLWPLAQMWLKRRGKKSEA